MRISIEGDKYTIKGQIPKVLLDEIPSIRELTEQVYTCPVLGFSSFSFACYAMKNKGKIEIDKEVGKTMKQLAKRVKFPRVYLRELEPNQVFLDIPAIPSYQTLISSLGARFRRLDMYSVPQSRLYEFYRIWKNWKHPFLPRPMMTEELSHYITRRLTKSEDMQSLFSIKPMDLYSVYYGYNITEDKLQRAMKRLKWENIGDLILTRPRKYENRTAVTSFKGSPFGTPLMFRTEFLEHLPNFSNKLIKFKVRDITSGLVVTCQMFGGQYMVKKMKPGDILNLVGMKIRGSVVNVSQVITDDEVRSLPIAPIYNASPSNGFTSKVITNCTHEVFERFDGSELFFYIKNDINFWDAVKSLHYPKDLEDYSKALDALAYYEMVAMQLMFIDNKSDGVNDIGVPKKHIDQGLFDEALSKIPFRLTDGQEKAIKSMRTKFALNKPADVLLSGDVGSGKSMIATLLALFVVDNKQQVVIAGPTEVLAQQLYQSVMKVVNLLDKKPTVVFLSGSNSSKSIKDAIKNGQADIIVGTHSVFNAKYKNLGFVVIDEQQKFGASQRDKLKEVGRKDGKKPDFLSQTATPIPRSTAQAFYGDIDLIQVHDKPAGRKEIITEWIKDNTEDILKNENSDMWNLVKREIDKGNQIFFIAPAVEDKDDTNFMTVEKSEKIIKKISPCLAIHGKMSKTKQKEVIESFRKGDSPILIGSSVLEVGIDVPKATVMVVLDADRFGALSLHQIRGRVGRNDMQSYCLLISSSDTKQANSRLTSLEDSNDGFDIAMADLKTRKEGDILGFRQSGESTLRFVDLVDHSSLIEVAQLEAQRIYKSALRGQAILDSKTFLRSDL